MRRHRGGAPTNEERESSSDEEDAFALLSRTSKKSKTKEEPQAAPLVVVEKPMQLPASTTSSNKRHHIPKEHRQAKMDALLEELASTASASNNTKTSLALDNHQSVQRGSFVRQGEENITTNLFVGNLAPSVTEEEMTELFSQFGTDRYSCSVRLIVMVTFTLYRRINGCNECSMCATAYCTMFFPTWLFYILVAVHMHAFCTNLNSGELFL
jgi:hypothetical protein